MKVSHPDSPLLAWVRRYLLAEILSTACALLAAGIAYALTRQALAAALANTAGGTISFYTMDQGLSGPTRRSPTKKSRMLSSSPTTHVAAAA